MPAAVSRTSSNGKRRASRTGTPIRGASQPEHSGADAAVEQVLAPRQWRNRIVGHGEEDAEQLLANPQNWRIHPQAQQQALEGVLQQVGWVQNVIVNQRTGFVVDGHARVAMAISAGEKVPVVYVDLSPEEEALILATLDPLAAMAATDEEKLKELICSVGTRDVPALDDLLQSLNGSSVHAPLGNGSQLGEGLEYRIIVDCTSEKHQAAMLQRFEDEGLNCRPLIS